MEQKRGGQENKRREDGRGEKILLNYNYLLCSFKQLYIIIHRQS